MTPCNSFCISTDNIFEHTLWTDTTRLLKWHCTDQQTRNHRWLGWCHQRYIFFYSLRDFKRLYFPGCAMTLVIQPNWPRRTPQLFYLPYRLAWCLKMMSCTGGWLLKKIFGCIPDSRIADLWTTGVSSPNLFKVLPLSSSKDDFLSLFTFIKKLRFIDNKVNDIIRVLGLHSVRHTIIGERGHGISGGLKANFHWRSELHIAHWLAYYFL